MISRLGRFSLWATLACMLPALAWGQVDNDGAEAWDPSPGAEAIDVAIALDTSGSMKGLIDAARLKLWEIVQELTLLDPPPRLRVGLLSYGRQDRAEAGWLAVETDLTTNLDRVSERLFALESEAGGGEYVARVVQTALQELSWVDSPDALKLIFVVGNEPADQDPEFSLREVSDAAWHEGILVHPIFCGARAHEHAASWKELAELTQGQFTAIDHRTGTVVVASPVDAELAELSAALNDTFVPLAQWGAGRKESLEQQDDNARQLGSAAAATRALVKASPMYSAGWDLIDALEVGTVELHELQESDLPEDLRVMSSAELERHVHELAFERKELRRRIAELGERRRQYVAGQMKEKGLDDSLAFDTAVRAALRVRLAEKGYRATDR